MTDKTSTEHDIIKQEVAEQLMRYRRKSIQTTLDTEHLRCFTGGNPDTERELFEIFLAEAHINICQMREAKQKNDDIAWRKGASKFKGSAASLGAVILSEICEEAEKKAHAPTHEKDKILAALQVEHLNIQIFIKQMDTYNLDTELSLETRRGA